MTYRDRLARKGIRPVVIERTVKAPGDKVLTTWAHPAVVHLSRAVGEGVGDGGRGSHGAS